MLCRNTDNNTKIINYSMHFHPITAKKNVTRTTVSSIPDLPIIKRSK